VLALRGLCCGVPFGPEALQEMPKQGGPDRRKGRAGQTECAMPRRTATRGANNRLFAKRLGHIQPERAMSLGGDLTLPLTVLQYFRTTYRTLQGRCNYYARARSDRLIPADQMAVGGGWLPWRRNQIGGRLDNRPNKQKKTVIPFSQLDTITI
jgi:hypothetical protein